MVEELRKIGIASEKFHTIAKEMRLKPYEFVASLQMALCAATIAMGRIEDKKVFEMEQLR